MNTEETPQETPVFSSETFRLLKKLHENPTSAFYASRKEDFSTKLETPFRRLFLLVAGEVSDSIKERMETGKGLFSRINKNDYGRGGAWDYFWGAFYPKGRKRIDSAQLYLEINHERLYFGFAIGVLADEQREQFIRNGKRHGQELADRLSRQLPNGMRYGTGSDSESTSGADSEEPREPTLEEWLRSPEELGISARVEVGKEEVLGASEAVLCGRIVRTFEALFPLVLAASSGDGELTALLSPFAPLDETVLEAGVALLVRSSGVRGGLGNAPAARSVRAKAIGDRAEELVFRELQRLDKRPKWVSREGLTPGWDIEYMEASGRVAVEVKGSTGDRFTSVELTANEWAAAQTERGNYHLYLVARCTTQAAKLEVIIDPASLVERGELDALPASWAIVRGG